ncbi:hypothetical protein LMANV2_90081 [Leptospira interrogans serovar Manilae]|uniref:Uncharacterized protein n=1 Tax=Leptospira interrogans serovar Manilae TaxID=214675 RepID=A0AAQ1P419_LEPIR|nr:hypothetical protein LMANV2_90081 [Leptospira interrogans serovar Manilae]
MSHFNYKTRELLRRDAANASLRIGIQGIVTLSFYSPRFPYAELTLLQLSISMKPKQIENLFFNNFLNNRPRKLIFEDCFRNMAQTCLESRTLCLF